MTFVQTFTSAYLALLVIALLFSSLGFIKYVYFISLGYGFSIAGIGVANLILFLHVLTLHTVILSALLIVYGCRLGFFLLFREIKSAAYRSTMKKRLRTEKIWDSLQSLEFGFPVHFCTFFRLLQFSSASRTMRLQTDVQLQE